MQNARVTKNDDALESGCNVLSDSLDKGGKNKGLRSVYTRLDIKKREFPRSPITRRSFIPRFCASTPGACAQGLA